VHPDHDDSRQPWVNGQHGCVTAFDDQFLNADERRLVLVLAMEKMDAFRNTSWRPVGPAEVVDGNRTYRSLLKNVNDGLFCERPVQDQDSDVDYRSPNEGGDCK